MGLQLALFSREYSDLLGVASGLFLGLIAAFLVRSLWNSFLSNLIGIVLLIPLALSTVWILQSWIGTVMHAPSLAGYQQRSWVHLGFWIGIPVFLLLGLQYRFLLALLESRIGLRVTRIPKIGETWLQGLRRAELDGNIHPGLEEQILSRVVFMTSPRLSGRAKESYGGIFCRPRIVVSAEFAQSPMSDSLLGELLEELIRIRRGTAFFEVLFLWMLPGRFRGWLRGFSQRACHREVVKRYRPLGEGSDRVAVGRSSRQLACILGLGAIVFLGWLAWREVRLSIDYHDQFKRKMSQAGNHAVS